MPKKILDLDTPFRKNERVVTTTDLVGAPEGTFGKVKLSNGLHTTNNWPRYWVRFENGEFMGQVSHADLVRPHLRDAWAEREAERAAAAEAAANASAAAADSAAVTPTGDAGGNDLAALIPPLLLERSRAARMRLLGY